MHVEALAIIVWQFQAILPIRVVSVYFFLFFFVCVCVCVCVEKRLCYLHFSSMHQVPRGLIDGVMHRLVCGLFVQAAVSTPSLRSSAGSSGVSTKRHAAAAVTNSNDDDDADKDWGRTAAKRSRSSATKPTTQRVRHLQVGLIHTNIFCWYLFNYFLSFIS